jgi:uncharacterized coiled-coil DUF342 family protein
MIKQSKEELYNQLREAQLKILTLKKKNRKLKKEVKDLQPQYDEICLDLKEMRYWGLIK